MMRRKFITLVGGAAAGWPLTVRAKQKTLPVIGFMSSRSPEDSQSVLAGFRKGLSESGIVEGKDVVIEFRWARGDFGRLPALAAEFVRDRAEPIFAESGGLLSYGSDTAELFRGAASYVDLILKGAKPAELPVQLPTKFSLIINLKTAEALGFTIAPTLLARADKLIE